MTEQQLLAVQIPLNQIHPDPRQPRRLLPPDLAEALIAGAAPSDILLQLRSRSKRDKSIRARLQELDGLADSIAEDGLMQPIRVIEDENNSYRIEQGERRWWAHHILVGRGDRRFDSIAAFVISKRPEKSGVLRRQVAENMLRSSFTAMELARAMATRIEEIASEEPTLARGEVEKRVGKENAMSDRRVRQYLALLKLPAEIQELAQVLRLTEASLRTAVAIKDPKRQLVAARALLHPPRNQTASRKLSRSEKRTKNVRLPQRAPKKPHRAMKAAFISRLLAMAKKIQSQRIPETGDVLKRRMRHNTTDRDAIVQLRALLDRALERTEHRNPYRFNGFVHNLGRRKAENR